MCDPYIDIVSAMPSASFSPSAPPQRRFGALATNAGERSGLALPFTHKSSWTSWGGLCLSVDLPGKIKITPIATGPITLAREGCSRFGFSPAGGLPVSRFFGRAGKKPGGPPCPPLTHNIGFPSDLSSHLSNSHLSMGSSRAHFADDTGDQGSCSSKPIRISVRFW